MKPKKRGVKSKKTKEEHNDSDYSEDYQEVVIPRKKKGK